jgi:hypothetical protein
LQQRLAEWRPEPDRAEEREHARRNISR